MPLNEWCNYSQDTLIKSGDNVCSGGIFYLLI